MYFSHALEILLHTVVESEADDEVSSENISSAGVLPKAIEFLDHFDAALDVVVGCARKTEMTRWKFLFGIVGNPKVLFDVSFIYLMLGFMLIPDRRNALLSASSRQQHHTCLSCTIWSSWKTTKEQQFSCKGHWKTKTGNYAGSSYASYILLTTAVRHCGKP